MTPTSTTAREREHARRLVQAFCERFGEWAPAYRLLAQHAALPLILTPELVSYLRSHFLRGQAPWVAEADLLLSDLCREVAYEQYVMEQAVRAVLIEELRRDPALGKARMAEVARLLIGYIRSLSRTDRPLPSHELQAQQWAAMVYLDDKRDSVARQIAGAFGDVLGPGGADRMDRAELARLASLTQTLASELAAYRELVSYGRNVARLLGDVTGRTTAELDRNGRLDASVQVLDVNLPTLREVVPIQRVARRAQLASILIVTVMKAEAQAVLEVFSQAAGKPWTRRLIGTQTYYNLGIRGGATVYMVQSQIGTASPGGALLAVRQAIEDLRPQAVIMCGIAFGLRPDKQQLGDILIAKQLQYYETQKADLHRGEMPHSDLISSSERLLDRFRSGDNDWQGARTHFGLILSGEKLVNDPAFHDWLLKTEPEALGGEMEGAGLYAAARDAKVDWILVKGICDWADGIKDDAAQAARNAAQFVLHVLQLGGWDDSVPHPESLEETEIKSENDERPAGQIAELVEQGQTTAKMPEKISQLHLYAVVSDIHGNYPALLAVEEDARRLAAAEGFLPPIFICLGDTVGYGPQPNECMDWLARVQPKIVLQGNHDAEAIRPMRSRPLRVSREFWAIVIWTRYVLKSQYRAALKEYPATQNGGNSLGDFAFFHSDPWVRDIYMDSVAQVRPFFSQLPVDYCFAAFGHLHFQMLFVDDGSVRAVYAQPEGLIDTPSYKCANRWHQVKQDARYLFNPGSVGQPRFHVSQPNHRASRGSLDSVGSELDRRAAYMLLYKDDQGDLYYQWRRVEYDRQETLRQLRNLAWPKDKDILKGASAPRPILEERPVPDLLTEAEMAQIMAELPEVVERLARMLE